jgi:GDPmannose 4,6-dehydratase
MWLMLQKDKPGDYVIATGETHSVKEFIEYAFNFLDLPLLWEGEGLEELGKTNGKTVIKINSQFFRPNELYELNGNFSKARKELGWEPKTTFKELVEMMIKSDFEKLKKVRE